MYTFLLSVAVLQKFPRTVKSEAGQKEESQGYGSRSRSSIQAYHAEQTEPKQTKASNQQAIVLALRYLLTYLIPHLSPYRTYSLVLLTDYSLIH